MHFGATRCKASPARGSPSSCRASRRPPIGCDSSTSNSAPRAEIAQDGDTSYVTSATQGDRDLYTMVPLGVTPLAIKGLQQTALACKDDAGDRALSLVVKSGTAIAVTPPTILGCSYAFTEAMHEQDPATGAPWTPAAVDAVQAGIEVAPVTQARVTSTALEVLVEAEAKARISSWALEVVHSVQKGAPPPPSGRRRAVVIVKG